MHGHCWLQDLQVVFAVFLLHCSFQRLSTCPTTAVQLHGPHAVGGLHDPRVNIPPELEAAAMRPGRCNWMPRRTRSWRETHTNNIKQYSSKHRIGSLHIHSQFPHTLAVGTHGNMVNMSGMESHSAKSCSVLSQIVNIFDLKIIRSLHRSPLTNV